MVANRSQALPRVPHEFALNARFHAVYYGDKNLIDLRIKVMASAGLSNYSERGL
jgi:hypothetical protein